MLFLISFDVNDYTILESISSHLDKNLVAHEVVDFNITFHESTTQRIPKWSPIKPAHNFSDLLLDRLTD